MSQRQTSKQRIVSLFSAAFVLLNLTACPKTVERNYYYQDGGQHGGGTIGEGSDQKDVRSIIGLALRMINDPDPRKNPVMRFAVEFNEAQNLRLEMLFPKLPSDLLKRNESQISFNDFDFIKEKFDRSNDFESPALAALTHNKRTLKIDGPCPEPENKNADASVTELNLSGELCLSVKNLSRIPKEALLATILGILVHESTHLAGADEKEAMEWQKTFTKYVQGRFASFALKDIASPIQFAVQNGQQCIDNYGRRLQSPDFENALKEIHQLYLCGFEILRNLSSIPSYWDPLELQLHIRPKHPERVYYLSNAILKAMEDIDHSLFLGVSPDSGKRSSDALNPMAIAQSLNLIMGDLSLIMQSLDTYRFDAPKPSECPLAKNPKFYISNPRLNIPSPGLGGPFLPPASCD